MNDTDDIPKKKRITEMTPEERREFFSDALDLWGDAFCRDFIRSCNTPVDKDGNPIPEKEVDTRFDRPSDIIDE